MAVPSAAKGFVLQNESFVAGWCDRTEQIILDEMIEREPFLFARHPFVGLMLIDVIYGFKMWVDIL